MIRGFAAVLLSLALALGATAEEGVLLKAGFMSGNIWARADRGKQSYYAMGVIDGMLAGAALSGGNKLAWLPKCTEGMESNQVREMLDAELRAQPGDWHRPYVHATMYRALRKACGQPVD